MFFYPAALMAYPNMINLLKSQTFFPNRDGQPQVPLVTLEAIPGCPGRASGELDAVQDNKKIREIGFMEETGIGGEVGLISGEDHSVSSDDVNDFL